MISSYKMCWYKINIISAVFKLLLKTITYKQVVTTQAIVQHCEIHQTNEQLPLTATIRTTVLVVWRSFLLGDLRGSHSLRKLLRLHHLTLLYRIDVQLVCLKFASNLNFKMNPPQNCSLLVPYEVYIKLFSKIQCFHPVLASWLSSIHLLEMIFFLR